MNRLLFLTLLVGCASKSTPAAPAPEAPPPAPVTLSTSTPPPSTLLAPPAAALGCAKEVALQCSDGFVDGCAVLDSNGASLTSGHVCVPIDAQPGPDCREEIAAECPDDTTDGCLTSPPKTTTHVCVQLP